MHHVGRLFPHLSATVSSSLRLATLASALVLSACGSDSSDDLSTGKDVCGATAEKIQDADFAGAPEGPVATGANKVFFLVSNYTDSTAVCSLDLATDAVRQEAVSEPSSNDWTLFRAASGDVYTVERFSGSRAKPSRITLRSGGSFAAKGERGDFPVNVQDAIVTNGGRGLLAVGYDRGEIALQPMDLSNGTDASYFPTRVLAKIPGGERSPNGQLAAVLEDAKLRAVVNTGYASKSGNGPQQVYVHLLDSAGKTVANSVPVKDAATGAVCVNAAGVLKVGQNQVLLSCNPQYTAMPVGNQVAVFLVSLSKGKVSTLAVVSEDPKAVAGYSIGGFARGGKFLVETRVRVGTSGASKVSKREWHDIGQPQAKPVAAIGGAKGFGGSFVFLPLQKKYVFSCSLAGDGSCKPKTFAVVPEAALFTGASKHDVEVKAQNDFDSFERRLMEAK